MLCVFYDQQQYTICEGIPDYCISDKDFIEILTTAKGKACLEELANRSGGSILIGRLGSLKNGIYQVHNVQPKDLECSATKTFDFFACV